MTTARILDPDGRDDLARQGFTVLPVLDPHQVRTLRDQFDALGVGPGGFVASPVGRSHDENEQISEAIGALVGPALDRVTEGYDVIGAAFLAKDPGTDGEMAVHQDFTSVDERRSHSLNVWCALTDVTPGDGGLLVIPGSHLWSSGVRSPEIPSIHLDLDGEIAPLLVGLTVPAGHAAFYDHRLFHGSGPNRGSARRIVAQLGLVPADEPLVMGFEGDTGPELRSVPPWAFFGPSPARPWPPPVVDASVVPVPVPRTDPDELRRCIDRRLYGEQPGSSGEGG